VVSKKRFVKTRLIVKKCILLEKQEYATAGFGHDGINLRDSFYKLLNSDNSCQNIILSILPKLPNYMYFLFPPDFLTSYYY